MGLLLVGATAATTVRSFAQTAQPPARSQTVTAPDNEQVTGPDTDTVDEQVGDQNAPDTGAEQAEEKQGADTDQVDEQVGNQSTADTAAETTAEAPEAADGQDAAPVGTPSITADQAKLAAEAHLNAGTATQVQLDDEKRQVGLQRHHRHV